MDKIVGTWTNKFVHYSGTRTKKSVHGGIALFCAQLRMTGALLHIIAAYAFYATATQRKDALRELATYDQVRPKTFGPFLDSVHVSSTPGGGERFNRLVSRSKMSSVHSPSRKETSWV